MRLPATLLDLRQSPRAHLDLPVRIRCHGPLGMRLEVTQTIDVSRGGLLVQSKQRCQPGTRVWVAYPYDPAASPASHSETAARVVRVEPNPPGGTTGNHNGLAQTYRVALKLRLQRKAARIRSTVERRARARVYSAVPIFVRMANGRRHGEAMTQDLSRGGVRFETSDIYAVGECIRAQISFAEWAGDGEIAGRVVRVETIDDVSLPAPIAEPGLGKSAMYTSVAVKWMPRV